LEAKQVNVSKQEFKAALKEAKKNRAGRFPLSNGWFVTAERIYPQPARQGPAWFFLFKVESPTRKIFGGRTAMDEMVNFFCNPRTWNWVDDYRANSAKSPESVTRSLEEKIS
jgi:hypothetical protein